MLSGFFVLEPFFTFNFQHPFPSSCVIIEVQMGNEPQKLVCVMTDGRIPEKKVSEREWKTICINSHFRGGERLIIPHWSVKICPYINESIDDKTLYSLGYPMNLNRVSKSDLQQIDGIGAKIAEQIILFRRTRGFFKSVDDMLKVRGIGKKKLEIIKKEARVY
jgi:competence ComEA-like helix-hairpin-helix protein